MIFGDQVRKQNFLTFYMCILFWYFCEISFGRDLGIEYCNRCISISPHNKKMFKLLLCGSPQLRKNIMINNNVLSFSIRKNRKCHQKAQKTVLSVINIIGGSPEILEIMALFSSSHHLTPRSADLILVRAETIKSFAIYLTYMYMLAYFH